MGLIGCGCGGVGVWGEGKGRTSKVRRDLGEEGCRGLFRTRSCRQGRTRPAWPPCCCWPVPWCWAPAASRVSAGTSHASPLCRGWGSGSPGEEGEEMGIGVKRIRVTPYVDCILRLSGVRVLSIFDILQATQSFWVTDQAELLDILLLPKLFCFIAVSKLSYLKK